MPNGPRETSPSAGRPSRRHPTERVNSEGDRRAAPARHAASGVHLTTREREVLEHVLRGEPNKEIATRLGLADQSVKDLVSVLLRKFRVRNRAALADTALQLDLVGESIERSWLPQLLRGASVQIAVTRGPEHRYVIANAAFAKAAGRDVVGKTMRESFPELEHTGHFALADRVYATGESVVGHEAAALWDRGGGPELTYTDGVLQALRGDGGEVEGLVFFGMDVTEQVRSRSAEAPAPEP